MNKNYIALYSVLLITLCTVVYAQLYVNTWVGFLYKNGELFLDEVKVDAYELWSGDLVESRNSTNGKYTIPVESSKNDSFIFFKLNGMIVNQEPQQMSGDGSVYNLDLTVTDTDEDSYAVGYDGYTGSDRDCNDTDNTMYPGATEICDYKDNDCDEVKDEDFPTLNDNCNYGICAGVYVCNENGSDVLCSTDNSSAKDEECNGLDDDCDTLIDEDLTAPSCNNQQGVCSGSTKTCGGVDNWLSCNATNYGDNYEAEESSCDNLDNDCDGITDNFNQSCYTGPEGTENVGECRGGNKTCTASSFGECIGEVTPITDIPNDGIDQDCDGADDESVTGDKNNVTIDGINETIFNITVDGSDDLTQNFADEKNVTFSEGNETIITFKHNFSESTLDMMNVTINVTNSSGKGAIVITNLNLQSDQKKTVYMDDINPTNNVCIKDVESLASVSELITSSCTGTDEHLITCNGVQSGDYTCTDLGNKYKIEGLTHSGVVENTYTPPSPPTPTGVGDTGGGGGGGGYVPPKVTEEVEEAEEEIPPEEEKEEAPEEEEKPTPTEEVTPEAEVTPPTPKGLGAITGAVIGAVTGKAGIGIFIIIIIVVGGLFLFSYFYGGLKTDHFTRASIFHRRAEKSHRKGKHQKAGNLYKKSQALREEGEKRLR